MLLCLPGLYSLALAAIPHAGHLTENISGGFSSTSPMPWGVASHTVHSLPTVQASKAGLHLLHIQDHIHLSLSQEQVLK